MTLASSETLPPPARRKMPRENMEKNTGTVNTNSSRAHSVPVGAPGPLRHPARPPQRFAARRPRPPRPPGSGQTNFTGRPDPRVLRAWAMRHTRPVQPITLGASSCMLDYAGHTGRRRHRCTDDVQTYVPSGCSPPRSWQESRLEFLKTCADAEGAGAHMPLDAPTCRPCHRRATSWGALASPHSKGPRSSTLASGLTSRPPSFTATPGPETADPTGNRGPTVRTRRTTLAACA